MQRQMFRNGGEALKPIPAGNKGLPKLPQQVRNRMGYMEAGGAVPPAAMEPMPPVPLASAQPPMMPGETMAATLPEDPMRDTLAAVQENLATLDEADNAEDMINAIRGNELPLEARYAELAELVGPEDAKQTPESVLALVQPTILMSLDQGIGALAQEEMDVPVEGPMAEGIMSTVAPPADPGPSMPMPMGAPPVNFNQGGLVRRGDNQPVQYFQDANPNRVAGMPSSPLMDSFEQRRDVYQSVLGDPSKNIEEQERLTRAQMLFDIAQTGLAFAAPMPGEKIGMSPAQRLALAATTTQLPQTIGARAAELQKVKTLADEQRRSLDLAALQAAEAEQTALAKAQADRDTAVVKAQLDLEKDLAVLGAKNIYELEQQENLFNQQTELQNTRLEIEQKIAKLERDRKERQDAITNAQGERKLQLTAEAQAFDEVYKNEKLALEGYAKRLTEFGTTTDARLGVYFSDPELLAKYAAGTLTPDETTKFNTMLAQYNNEKKVWDDELKTFKLSPGNPLSNELMSAIEMRRTNKTGPLPNIAYVRELNKRENEEKSDPEKPDAVFSRIMEGVDDPTAAFGSDASGKDIINSAVEFVTLGYAGAPFKATKDAVTGAQFLNTKTVQTFQKAAELRDSVAQLNLLKSLTADPAAFFTGDDAAASKISKIIALVDEATDLIDTTLNEYPLDSAEYTEAKKNKIIFGQIKAGYEVFDNAYKMREGRSEELENEMREILGLNPKQ